MKPGAPWSIKGVDPATREAAKAAAAAAGMSLGQWLNQMVAEAQKAPATKPAAAPPRAAPEPVAGPTAPETAVASPAEWQTAARDLATRLQETERRIAAVVVPLRQQVATLQAKIQGLETELAGLRALPPGPPANPVVRPEPARPESVPPEAARPAAVQPEPAPPPPPQPPKDDQDHAPAIGAESRFPPADEPPSRPAPLPPDADILDSLTRRPLDDQPLDEDIRQRRQRFHTPSEDSALRQPEEDRPSGARRLLVVAVIMLVALTMAGLGWYGLREVAPNAGMDLMKLLRGQPVAPPARAPTPPNQAQAPAPANPTPAPSAPTAAVPANPPAAALAPQPAPGAVTPPAPAATAAAPETNDPLRALRDAARTGEARAQFNLGVAYYKGEGVARDYAEAGRWFERAAKQNLADAQFALASMFEKGEGMAADPAMAILWYEAAANQNFVPAMFNIGALYAQGKGAAQDYVQAGKWFERAAAFGLPNALVNLAIIAEGGYGRPASDRDAYRWYALAVKQGDSQSDVKKRALAQRLPAADVAAIDREVAAWRPRPVVPGPRGALPAEKAVAPAPAAATVPAAAPTPANALDRDGLTRLQMLLGRLGYDVGTPDGLMGERTRRAIQDYQRSMGLPTDGQASQRLLEQVEGGGRARS